MEETASLTAKSTQPLCLDGVAGRQPELRDLGAYPSCRVRHPRTQFCLQSAFASAIEKERPPGLSCPVASSAATEFLQSWEGKDTVQRLYWKGLVASLTNTPRPLSQPFYAEVLRLGGERP